MTTQQPEPLLLAAELEQFAYRLAQKSARELRRLHAESELHQQELASYRFTVENREARIAELEAQLAAVQQGVQSDAKTHNRCLNDFIEFANQIDFAKPRSASLNRKFILDLRDAILGLYAATHTTTQRLDADTQNNADIGAAVMRACKDLPEGAEIQIYLERGAGTVHMTDWDGNEFDHFSEDHEDFACQINAATDGAIAATCFAAQAKQGEQA